MRGGWVRFDLAFNSQMNAFRVAMATSLVLALAAVRADPYVGTDDAGNLQLRSAPGPRRVRQR